MQAFRVGYQAASSPSSVDVYYRLSITGASKCSLTCNSGVWHMQHDKGQALCRHACTARDGMMAYVCMAANKEAGLFLICITLHL